MSLILYFRFYGPPVPVGPGMYLLAMPFYKQIALFIAILTFSLSGESVRAHRNAVPLYTME